MTLEEAILSSGNIWMKGEAIGAGVVRFGNLCTLEKYADMEDRVAANVVRILRDSHEEYPESLIDHYISEFEKAKSARLHPLQKNAVRMIVNNTLSVLTGGPGTGKTTTINCAKWVLRALSESTKIVFCAPTGKAAMRMRETTGEKASTVQSVLGLGYNAILAKEFCDDVMFLDECSMADLQTTDILFEATRPGRRLVWIGDVNQLPSVGPGAVLRDLIASGVVPTTQLTKTFRQNGGLLLDNIYRIKDGNVNLESGNSFEICKVSDTIIPEDVDSLIARYYCEEVEKYGIDDVTVLLPYHKAGYGSNRINRLIQSIYNPSGAAWTCGEWTFRCGDPVMQQVNRLECVNGEIGKVVEVSQSGLNVEYSGGKSVIYTAKELMDNELELGYAMSVTKSQGSEYKSVIMCQLDSHSNALNRNILYTGASRAKETVRMITQSNALMTSLSHTAGNRVTMLAQKIKAVAA